MGADPASWSSEPPSSKRGPRTLTEREPPLQRQALHANFQIRVERKQMAKNGKPNIPII